MSLVQADKQLDNYSRAKASNGKEFLCRKCKTWNPSVSYEYKQDESIHLALRCNKCRDIK